MTLRDELIAIWRHEGKSDAEIAAKLRDKEATLAALAEELPTTIVAPTGEQISTAALLDENMSPTGAGEEQ